MIYGALAALLALTALVVAAESRQPRRLPVRIRTRCRR